MLEWWKLDGWRLTWSGKVKLGKGRGVVGGRVVVVGKSLEWVVMEVVGLRLGLRLRVRPVRVRVGVGGGFGKRGGIWVMLGIGVWRRAEI